LIRIVNPKYMFNSALYLSDYCLFVGNLVGGLVGLLSGADLVSKRVGDFVGAGLPMESVGSIVEAGFVNVIVGAVVGIRRLGEKSKELVGFEVGRGDGRRDGLNGTTMTGIDVNCEHPYRAVTFTLSHPADSVPFNVTPHQSLSRNCPSKYS
jgi:hypothetical protein